MCNILGISDGNKPSAIMQAVSQSSLAKLNIFLQLCKCGGEILIGNCEFGNYFPTDWHGIIN